jgi:NhaA family Na+:H+ antiporter
MLDNTTKPLKAIREFLKVESASGLLLIAAMIVALILENSPLSVFYDQLLQTRAGVRIGALGLDKPLLLWINDGLMAIFFLLVGLEVKREMREGQLSNLSQITLPGIAALGGMAIPALIYVWFNQGDVVALNGWAIPAATDIAFALGILSLHGNRVPLSLKLFLMTVAIMDDLGAIFIIAIFYSADISLLSLILAAIMLTILFGLNRSGVTQITPYVITGTILWIFVLKSGVHATLAGVALAFAIPLRAKNKDEPSPLHHLEHSLHPWVAFGIMPLFALANAGVSLQGISLPTLLEPVPFGIIIGLFVGKQFGIFGFTWLGVKLGMTRLPGDISWLELYGVAILCGIGFTMSLFIASLAFEHGAVGYIVADRLGILLGSLLSAALGYALLHYAFVRKRVGDSLPLES